MLSRLEMEMAAIDKLQQSVRIDNQLCLFDSAENSVLEKLWKVKCSYFNTRKNEKEKRYGRRKVSS